MLFLINKTDKQHIRIKKPKIKKIMKIFSEIIMISKIVHINFIEIIKYNLKV